MHLESAGIVETPSNNNITSAKQTDDTINIAAAAAAFIESAQNKSPKSVQNRLKSSFNFSFVAPNGDIRSSAWSVLNNSGGNNNKYNLSNELAGQLISFIYSSMVSEVLRGFVSCRSDF